MAAKKVLIVEDDSILANALAGAVKKAGYESLICQRPDDALEALDKDSFRVVFIDCLLPQTPGTDLAKAIRKNFDAKILPIVLMSGIFTDKQMMKEMVQEISALDFLKKPFEVNEVLKFLEKESAASLDESLARSLLSLPDRAGANPAALATTLHEINRIHGFELPILFAATVGNSYSGEIHLMSDKGEKTKVTLSKGTIVAVESPDTQSYLGKLLVANGWVLSDDLEFVLSQPSEKKLGQRLTDDNYISPHAVFEVMEEQMAMRLAKVVQDQNYVLHFEEKLVEINGPTIDPEEFYLLLDDWISSKVSGDWLNQQFSHLLEYSVRLGPSHDRNRREYKVKSIESIKDIVSSIESTSLLSSLQQKHQSQLAEFNRGFYYMLCLGFVIFAEKVGQMSEAERVARLQKLWTQMKDLSVIESFQLIGGRKDMNSEEVKKIYSEFVQKYLGTVPRPGANPALISVHESVRSRVSEGYELFLDPQKLLLYERDLEAGKMSQRSEAQAKLDQAKKFLSMRQFANASSLVNKASQLFPSLDYLTLYQVWAKVGLVATSKTKSKDLLEIDQLLIRIPAEEKNSAIGQFVQGLVARSKGEIAIARKFFDGALALDKTMIEARRELNSLPVETKKPVDLLHGDITQVFGSLFKKS